MICSSCLDEIDQRIPIRADGVCVGCGRHYPDAEVPGQRELQSLVADARLRGAIVRVRYSGGGIAEAVQIRRGIAGVGPRWMPPIQATEALRGFVAAKN